MTLRGRSPGPVITTGRHSGYEKKNEKELLAILERARHDYGWARNMDNRHYWDMIGLTSRLHGDPRIQFPEPQDFMGPGRAPSSPEFREKTTLLNLSKLLYLENLNPGLEDIFANTMRGRNATRGVNQMLGSELDSLYALFDVF